jgi:hypothetical protein
LGYYQKTNLRSSKALGTEIQGDTHKIADSFEIAKRWKNRLASCRFGIPSAKALGYFHETDDYSRCSRADLTERSRTPSSDNSPML